ncbi:signal recognition particle-docking protein FtsY [Ideonella sp.]|uniref:signal recognition particle-docking protein FtsY n=1 Tax=Ideonella sp. TaxID=1929293 RepID=UPI0037C111E8
MFSFFRKKFGSAPPPAPEAAAAPAPAAVDAPSAPPAAPAAGGAPSEAVASVSQSPALEPQTPAPTPAPIAVAPAVADPHAFTHAPEPTAKPEPAAREGWLSRLRKGLARTGSSIAQVFTGTKITDELYEELEAALLMADTGVKATEHLLEDLKRRVKEAKATDPAAVKALLADAITELLAPLEKALVVGEHHPTVMMVVGVNGAGKTTSIGKLTKHLAESDCKVLLAAADTFRAAAREQLGVWADRNRVEIISQEGGDPAAVTFDAVTAGKARGSDVVIADTAGRLPTQLHLMEELKKIKRVIGKADTTAPHQVLLVVDGNTGQNALTQVKAFDDALGLTGLIVTKLDGTAKGGVLAAIARERPLPVYFIGVGEKLEDLQTFKAREFAKALLD